MKQPLVIFIPVAIICALMLIILPQAARPAPAVAAAASAPTAGAPAAAPVQQPTIAPTLAPEVVVEAQAAQEELAAPAEAEPAAPDENAPQPQVQEPQIQAGAQANAPAGESLPSPADPSASSGQGLAAIPQTSSLPGLDAFIASVSDGQPGRLAGVYVPGELALPVIQQPAGDSNYVDTNDNTVTQYARSAAYDVVGLLAHNTLTSGQSFFRLKPGQEVFLIFGDGRQARYRIDHVENYQALSSADPYTDFVDLNGPGGQLVLNDDLFRRIYTNAGEVVFQTCFEANGDPSWGRMFVVAKPI